MVFFRIKRESRAVAAATEKLCQTVSARLADDGVSGVAGLVFGTEVEEEVEADPSAAAFNFASSGVGGQEALVRALRCLLAAVTKVLLLADSVVVRQLLVSKGEVLVGQEEAAVGGPEAAAAAAAASDPCSAAGTMRHFTEFVKAFCDFGIDMIHLAQAVVGER